MKTLTTKRFFRVFFLFLAMISTLLLTACGGGGSDVIDADNSAIVGKWYLNTEDELPVKGNIPTFDFKSDGSFTMVDYDLDLRNNEYWEGYGEPGYVTGTWSFSDGLVKVLVDAGKMTMEFTQNSLKLSGEYEDGSGTWTSIYKRTPYKDNNLDNDADKEKIYGKWYLNYDDDFPVKGNIPTFDFKSDGSVYIVEYELDFRNNEYWEGVGEPEYINGIWSLNGNTIRIIADDSYLDITVNSDTLTFTDESEDESDTWTFTYKKTKYVD